MLTELFFNILSYEKDNGMSCAKKETFSCTS
jgi:hypothetical protein